MAEETTFMREDIRNKDTGQVIHYVEELLNKHVGHGSARKKKWLMLVGLTFISNTR